MTSRAINNDETRRENVAEFKHYNTGFHLAFFSDMVAVEFRLSNLISSLWIKDSESSEKLFLQPVRVSLLTDSISGPLCTCVI